MNRWAAATGAAILVLLFAGRVDATSIFSYDPNAVGWWTWPDGGRAGGMGNTATAMYDEMNPYGVNPATIAAFKRTALTMSFVSQRRGVSDAAGGSATFHDQNFRVFRLVTPIARGVVLGFGLEPVSDVMIKWSNTATDAGVTLNDSLEASGGLWAGTLELAREFGQFSFGAEARLVRGEVSTEWRRTILQEGAPLATSALISRQYNGILYGLGAVYRIGETARRPARWTFGLHVQPPAGLDYTSYSSLGTRIPLWWQPGHEESTPIAPDLNDTTSATADLPLAVNLGATYRPNAQLLAAFDIGYMHWKALDSRFSNTWRAGLGVEVRPSDDYRSFYALQWPYRFGVRWEQHYIPAPVKIPSGIYVSAGAGIPIGQGVGKLDYSIEFGQRGTLETNSVRERVWRHTISLVGWESWFQYRPRR
jgi:hypothetical protein